MALRTPPRPRWDALQPRRRSKPRAGKGIDELVDTEFSLWETGADDIADDFEMPLWPIGTPGDVIDDDLIWIDEIDEEVQSDDDSSDGRDGDDDDDSCRGPGPVDDDKRISAEDARDAALPDDVAHSETLLGGGESTSAAPSDDVRPEEKPSDDGNDAVDVGAGGNSSELSGSATMDDARAPVVEPGARRRVTWPLEADWESSSAADFPGDAAARPRRGRPRPLVLSHMHFRPRSICEASGEFPLARHAARCQMARVGRWPPDGALPGTLRLPLLDASEPTAQPAQPLPARLNPTSVRRTKARRTRSQSLPSLPSRPITPRAGGVAKVDFSLFVDGRYPPRRNSLPAMIVG